ncbi:MAG: glycosyltransferase family 2 protein [Fimbriimonadales bacterium]
MEKRPLVSIIINNYNYERYLTQSIESALAQTYHPIEVIVVDDGSTDGSRDLIARYEGKVKPVFKANGGQASAFNAGFPHSQGELVMYLDADDYLKPNAIEIAVAHWRTGLAVLQWRLQGADPEGKPLDPVFPKRAVGIKRGDIRSDYAWTGYYPHPPTSGILFARATLAEILPIDEQKWRISADAPLYTIAPFLGELEFVDEILGYYRLHGANLWNNPKPDLKRLMRSVEHEQAKAEMIRHYATQQGIRVNPNLGFTNPGYVLQRLLLLMLGHRAPGMEHDTVSDLARKGIRAALTYPYELPIKSRLRLVQLFASAWVLPKERVLWAIMRRAYSRATHEQLEDLLNQARVALSANA